MYAWVRMNVKVKYGIEGKICKNEILGGNMFWEKYLVGKGK